VSEWREYYLSEVGILKRGKSKYRPRYAFHLYGGVYPFIQTGDVKAAQKYITKYSQTYSEAGLQQSKLWNKGTLCITIAANIAEIGILGFDSCFPDSILGFIADEKNSTQDYVFYLLAYAKRELLTFADGSVQDNINLGTFEKIKFLFPPLLEQHSIAGVLSPLDDKIDFLTRQNATLDALAQTYFRQWFVEEARDDWETGKAEDYFDIAIGKTPPRQEHEWFTESPIDNVWVSIGDMGKAGLFIGQSSEYLTDEAIERFNIRRIPKGSILLSFKLTVGRVSIALCEMTTNEAIAHFICKEDRQREYLYCYLKSFEYYSLGSTSSIASAVNSKIIKAMPFIMPDGDILDEFHELTMPMFTKMETNAHQTLTLQKLRDTLLPKLISGEVRVKQ